MPIADAKVEKQTSPEAAEPIKQAIIIIEHKVRNLEKRKRKIEIYREDQKNGQTLNVDQLLAVSKYGEVTKTLDFAHELCKQFSLLAVETNKLAKKQARKESIERASQEAAKIRDILVVQDLLQNMGHDAVREDFLAGRKNAVQLSAADLKHLDDLYVEVSPKRLGKDEDGPPFMDQVASASEHLLALVEGKTKEVVGTTHDYLMKLVNKIQQSGYFDLNVPQPVEELIAEVSLSDTRAHANEIREDVISEPELVAPEAPSCTELNEIQCAIPSAPLAASLPIPSSLVAQPQPPTMLPAVPPPAAAVNSSYFSTEQANNFVGHIPHQTVTELIQQTVGGSFNFLQDSELDSDMFVAPSSVPTVAAMLSQIPSQTYTNQNAAVTQTGSAAVSQAQVYPVDVPDMTQSFPAGTVIPPPPIPMPLSHQTNSGPYNAGSGQPPPPGNTYQHPTPQQTDYQQVQPAVEGLRTKADAWATMSEPSGPASTVTSDWIQKPEHPAEWTQDQGTTDWVQQMAEESAVSYASQNSARPYSGSSGGSSGNRSNRTQRPAGGNGPTTGGGNNPARSTNATGNYPNPRPGARTGANLQNGNNRYNNYAPRNVEHNSGSGYYQQQNGYQQRDAFPSNGSVAGQGGQGQQQGQHFRQRPSRDRGPAVSRGGPSRGGLRASPSSGADAGSNPRSNARAGPNASVLPRSQNIRQ